MLALALQGAGPDLQDWLVMVAEEHLVNSCAWWEEDVTHEWERDICKVVRDWHKERDYWRNHEDQKFTDRILALEERHLEV